MTKTEQHCVSIDMTKTEQHFVKNARIFHSHTKQIPRRRKRVLFDQFNATK